MLFFYLTLTLKYFLFSRLFFVTKTVLPGAMFPQLFDKIFFFCSERVHIHSYELFSSDTA
jgi:hypothetical protein